MAAAVAIWLKGPVLTVVLRSILKPDSLLELSVQPMVTCEYVAAAAVGLVGTLGVPAGGGVGDGVGVGVGEQYWLV